LKATVLNTSKVFAETVNPMPQQFTYKDNETGRTVTFNQDTEPTEEQIAAKFEAETTVAPKAEAPVAPQPTAVAPAIQPAPAPFRVLPDDEILDGAKRLRELGKEGPEVEAFIAKARKEQRDNENRLLDEGDISKVGQLADAAETVAKATAQAGAEGLTIGLAASLGQRAGAALPGVLKIPGVPAGGALSGIAADYAVQAAQAAASGQPFRYDIPRGLGTGFMSAIPGMPMAAAASPAMQTARQGMPALTRTLEYFLSRSPAEIAKNIYGTVGGAAIEKAARGEGALTGEEMAKATGIGYAGGRVGAAATPARARPTIKDQIAFDDVANVRRREWMELGGLVDPSTSNRDSTLNKALKTASGTRGQDQIAIKNQNLTDKLAREDMRFPSSPDGTALPLSDKNYQSYLNELGTSLRKIEALGQNFPSLIDSYKTARDEARDAWVAWRAAKAAPSGRGTAQELANAQRLQVLADTAGNAVDQALVAANQTNLKNEWRAANKLFSKTYNNWAATIDGRIDASILADMHGEGQIKRLSGNQKLIAEMAQGDAPVMRHPSVIQGEKIGVSPAAATFAASVASLPGGLLGGLSQGLSGAAYGAGAAAVAGGLAGPAAARGIMASPFYQKTLGFARPEYGSNRPATPANIARFVTEFGMSSPSMAPATSILQFQQ
jgi:hypothetical protein